MRSAALVLTLFCALPLGPAVAEDPPKQESGEALVQAVKASPDSLSVILRRTHKSKHRPLRAAFALDTRGQLVAQVLLRVAEDEGHTFHEWTGPVYSAGWVPRRRVLVDDVELVEARRLSNLEPGRDVLWRALVEAVCQDRTDRPADVVLSAVPSSRGGKSAVDLYVSRAGRRRGVAFDPFTDAFAAADVTAPQPVSVEARSLPALEVPDGKWFNTETAPSLAKLRGRPVLVLVTSPG